MHQSSEMKLSQVLRIVNGLCKAEKKCRAPIPKNNHVFGVAHLTQSLVMALQVWR
jgi:hypothetical protein